ncbi:hypothetical protein pb186bvf_018170 [Paramecium bursaria]
MIQIFDNQDKLIYKYHLRQGKNIFGGDPKQCHYVIRDTQPILIQIINYNYEVYLKHYSQNETLFKQTTMKSDSRSRLKVGFAYEMHPNQYFYYRNFKFKLVEEDIYVPAQFTQVIEGFGTQILDDITPQYIQQNFVNAPTTQIVSTQDITGTMVLNSQQDNLVDELMDQFLDVGIEDKFTQTDNDLEPLNSQIIQKVERPSDQKPISLFSSAMNFLKPKQEENSRSNEEIHHDQPVNNQLGATIGGTVVNTIVGTIVGTAQGTVFDDNLDQVFGSQGIRNIPENKQQQQLIKQQSIQPRSSTNYESNFQQSPQFNLQFGDLFGSSSNNDQVIRPTFQRKYLKQPSFMTKGSEESEKVQESPIKKQESVAEPQSSNKELKNYKFDDKNQIKLKKITDQSNVRKRKINEKQTKNQTKLKRLKSSSESASEESSEEEQEQNQSKKQLRQQSSIELPPGKDFGQRVEKSLKESKQTKQQGRRKLRKISQQIEVYKIQFSGFDDDEIPSKDELEAIGLEMIDEPSVKYDILILGEVKRTFKLLQALMMGAFIVNTQWLKDSIKDNEIKAFQDYVPDSDDFTNQFSITLNYVIENRDQYFKSNENKLEIFNGTYYVDKDVKPSKIKIEELIKLGGEYWEKHNMCS